MAAVFLYKPDHLNTLEVDECRATVLGMKWRLATRGHHEHLVCSCSRDSVWYGMEYQTCLQHVNLSPHSPIWKPYLKSLLNGFQSTTSFRGPNLQFEELQAAGVRMNHWMWYITVTVIYDLHTCVNMCIYIWQINCFQVFSFEHCNLLHLS